MGGIDIDRWEMIEDRWRDSPGGMVVKLDAQVGVGWQIQCQDKTPKDPRMQRVENKHIKKAISPYLL